MAQPRKPSTRTKRPAITDEQKAAEKANRNLIFIRLGEKRLARVAKSIRGLTNLARYPHSEKQAEKVMLVLNEAVQAVSFSFAKVEAPSEGISLSDK